MDSPPLDNQTDFVVHPQLLLDKDGEKVVIIVKATWELPPGAKELDLTPPDRARGIRAADVPWSEIAESSTLFPSDFCVHKPGTDVIVVARAYASGGQAQKSFDVSVRVGALNKVLRVFGRRLWVSGGEGMTEPQAIKELDLRYEYARGGAVFNDEGEGVEEALNPVGRGVALDDDDLTHQQVAQLEDPFDPISSSADRPAPAGIGAVGRSWEPRRSYSGTYDEAWLDERAPLPPVDQDYRVHQAASAGLVAAPPLRGDELVALGNLMPGGGTLTFELPRVAVDIEVLVKGRDTERFRPHLDTVVIDQLFGARSGQPTVELVWRAAVKAPRRMKDAQIIVREVATA